MVRETNEAVDVVVGRAHAVHGEGKEQAVVPDELFFRDPRGKEAAMKLDKLFFQEPWTAQAARPQDKRKSKAWPRQCNARQSEARQRKGKTKPKEGEIVAPIYHL